MTCRRKRFCMVSAVVLLTLIAIQTTTFVRPPRKITIGVDGTPGQSVVASFDVDGTRHKESKELPANFTFHARDVSFVVISDSDPSDSHMTVNAYRDDDLILTCRDKNGVRGKVMVSSLLGLGSTNNGIGGLRPDHQDAFDL